MSKSVRIHRSMPATPFIWATLTASLSLRSSGAPDNGHPSTTTEPWGVVAILEGVLEERSYVPAGNTIDDSEKIDLRPGGIVLLAPGSVTTFVPNPDHIHMTGVPKDRQKVISLHLYGRLMNNYHFYDLKSQSRRLVEVSHFES